ncbi:MAG: hypothetical protein V3V08_06480 [Nannocystaceae bacterium]
MRSALFPGYFPLADEGAGARGEANTGSGSDSAMDRARSILRRQIELSLAFTEVDDEIAVRRTERVLVCFAEAIREIQRLLATDVIAARDGDPSTRSVHETILCFPGVLATLHHRIAHQLARLEVPLLPRMIAELAHSATGIDLHPKARIGEAFFIDHGTGVVIGETCRIGDRVRVYQGVTLGARRFELDDHGRPIKGHPRHPIVENDVTLYAGATVLGRVTIGHDSIIGGNVWLTKGVPPFSRVNQAQLRHDRFDQGAGI